MNDYRRNPDGSVTIGCIEDSIPPFKKEELEEVEVVETVTEKPAPKKGGRPKKK